LFRKAGHFNMRSGVSKEANRWLEKSIGDALPDQLSSNPQWFFPSILIYN